MPDRIANIGVLVEDKIHRNLLLRYLERCGHGQREIRFESLPAKGSGEQYVRKNFARLVGDYRRRAKMGKTLLIVMIDADTQTVQTRKQQLTDALRAVNEKSLDASEPIVVLIPKRNVETWICALLGEQVNEGTDYAKGRGVVPSGPQIAQAAEKLFEITRPHAVIPPDYPPSLMESIAEWQKIPKL